MRANTNTFHQHFDHTQMQYLLLLLNYFLTNGAKECKIKRGVACVDNLFWVVLLTSFMYSLHLKWHLSAIVDNSINKLILMVGQIWQNPTYATQTHTHTSCKQRERKNSFKKDRMRHGIIIIQMIEMNCDNIFVWK